MATAADNGTRVRAQAKWVRTSARKARIVLANIRGRSVPEARTVLAFTQRAAALDVDKVLRAAVANAEANHGLHGDDLLVAEAFADEGPTLKRWRARARGRVNRINKRTCHITVVLAPAAQERLARRESVASESTETTQTTEAGASKPKASTRRTKAAKEAKV